MSIGIATGIGSVSAIIWWQHLSAFGSIWDHPATSGTIWHHLAPSGFPHRAIRALESGNQGFFVCETVDKFCLVPNYMKNTIFLCFEKWLQKRGTYGWEVLTYAKNVHFTKCFAMF